MVPLLDEEDNHLRDKSTSSTTLKAAYKRIIAAQAATVNAQPEVKRATSAAKPSAYKVSDVCTAYLEKAESDESQTTYNMRADTLFDFCTG
jgi:hypothetical protein